MEISTETLEDRQLRLTIELNEEQTEKAMRRAARRIARQVNIPGFRKGKAPYERIVQQYGEDTVRQEATEMLAEEVYREALKQEEITPYAPGRLEDVEPDPFTFTFTVPLPPTVDLGDYRAYRLEAKKVQVPEKDVERALDEIQEQNAILELVERPAALDDGVVIDLAARTPDGTEILNVDELRLLLDAESASPAPGFAESVVGMEADDERTFTLTLPDDFPKEEYQGQEAEFTVRMKEVYDSTLPDLDDDLARTVGSFDSFTELEDHVRNQLRETAQREADETYRSQVLEAILEAAQVEHPPVMLEEALDEAVEEVERAVKQQTRLSLENYLRFQGKTMEELREDLEPRAAAQVKRSIVLSEVVAQEELAVDEQELDAHIEQVSAAWGARADEVRSSLASDAGKRTVRNSLLVDKAIQRLVAIAKGEAPEPASAVEQEDEEAETPEAGSEKSDAASEGSQEEA